LQQLVRDPRFVGGQIGMIGVLQTWARDMSHHPHVHYLAPGGGVAADGQRWLPGRQDFPSSSGFCGLRKMRQN
jgi:hypothetical protein